MSPLAVAVVACAALAGLCWSLSLLTRDYQRRTSRLIPWFPGRA